MGVVPGLQEHGLLLGKFRIQNGFSQQQLETSQSENPIRLFKTMDYLNYTTVTLFGLSMLKLDSERYV